MKTQAEVDAIIDALADHIPESAPARPVRAAVAGRSSVSDGGRRRFYYPTVDRPFLGFEPRTGPDWDD